MFSYLGDGGVESRDLEVGVGGRGAVPLHGNQPGWRHLVGVLGRKRHEHCELADPHCFPRNTL